MKLELLFILFVCIVVFYDGYIKGPISIIYTYSKVLIGVIICIYLIYSYYKSPEDFKEALDLVKSFFIGSDNFIEKHLEKIKSLKPKISNRNVTALQKKKVAASQEWKCGHCMSILDASYEVDHIVALYRGGTNSETNLVALCRNCHGKKTVNERLSL
jgi:hypothetical protein